jgi:hypothetical protein
MRGVGRKGVQVACALLNKRDAHCLQQQEHQFAHRGSPRLCTLHPSFGCWYAAVSRFKAAAKTRAHLGRVDKQLVHAEALRRAEALQHRRDGFRGGAVWGQVLPGDLVINYSKVRD